MLPLAAGISGEVTTWITFLIYERRKLMKSYREPFPRVSVNARFPRKVLLILFTKQFELPARRSTSRIISPAVGSSSFTETRVFIKPFRAMLASLLGEKGSNSDPNAGIPRAKDAPVSALTALLEERVYT